MPLTHKGEEIRRAMEREYGKKRGESVFYASRNKGTITGVDGAKDELRRAIAAGKAESEHQKQAQRLLSGAHVSGRDRAKLRR